MRKIRTVIISCLALIFTCLAYGANPVLIIEERAKLSFEADDLFSDRVRERYEAKPAGIEIRNATEALFKDALNFLPEKYWPASLIISLEYKATVKGELETGLIPISLVNSYQLPKTSSIRLGMMELKNDFCGYKWVLGHELGHMLVEWTSRAEGSTQTDAPRIAFWPQPVYEGVGDFLATRLTPGRCNLEGRWFYRDPFRFKTLAQAQSEADNTITRAEAFFKNTNIIDHPLYADWVAKVKEYSGGVDPYMPGSWVAGQLLQLSHKYGDKKVFGSILRLAGEGIPISDEIHFLAEVQRRCCNE